ncbi:MAG: endonuclease domain-containing protein [Myxococcota bacterium]
MGRSPRFDLTLRESCPARCGVSFRRQVVIGERIVDFLAPSCRLVVEVDGAYHAASPRADARGQCELERLGYRVIRFTNERVLRELESVLAEIRRALA